MDFSWHDDVYIDGFIPDLEEFLRAVGYVSGFKAKPISSMDEGYNTSDQIKKANLRVLTGAYKITKK